MSTDAAPPFVDEHATTAAAPPDRVWAALEQYADRVLAHAAGGTVARLLGTDPPGGFGVAVREPGRRLALDGRHRFSRYRLELVLDDAPTGGTRIRARTLAAFPGVSGQVYRTLVIRSRLHVLAVRRMLARVRAAAERPPEP
ncbi:hypothetical protein EKO23_11115 [Nocardioides guangzhouensis]|uniref:DUF2867 domain-containing protein n=1 Tax=Nocardioides guangzhouensis TaxID=2497878 RepID=A0A4Q4ZEN4_9ACTN|nr:hypothetical protein [Nocardioides guangzhouensis]RYP85856.1 hypothetical protein EKO23_11115 [Nocardioides guangzhouensis]